MPCGLGGASRIGIVVFCRRSRRVVLGSWWGVKYVEGRRVESCEV